MWFKNDLIPHCVNRIKRERGRGRQRQSWSNAAISESGYLKKSADSRQAAEFVVTLQEGAFAIGKTLSNPKLFDSMSQSLTIYLDSFPVA